MHCMCPLKFGAQIFVEKATVISSISPRIEHFRFCVVGRRTTALSWSKTGVGCRTVYCENSSEIVRGKMCQMCTESRAHAKSELSDHLVGNLQLLPDDLLWTRVSLEAGVLVRSMLVFELHKTGREQHVPLECLRPEFEGTVQRNRESE